MGGFALYDQGIFKCHLRPDVYGQRDIDQEWEIAKGLEQTMELAISEMLRCGYLVGADLTPSFPDFGCLGNTDGQHGQPSSPLITEGAERRPLILKQYSCLLELFVANGFILIEEKFITNNLSHTDFTAKTIAIVQTSWFMLQCLAHGIKGIAITELEVYTLAFAALNGMTYILWWNKPQRVHHPIPVHWHPLNICVTSMPDRSGPTGHNHFHSILTYSTYLNLRTPH
ncbi:hypothetical protein E1B28_003764 [Marasmius oreades]|uniref:Uncharacterized protein n=1 Tax=Marasmius oreades TaxID=181124 RepID=A0A9P7UX86_9AGAR|nr:uncharacterized protein E1B28_003764 [Marasmius oreades]KAG7096319.1 hypothetical protein E1B28_003764 [Marasmius oreades]